MLVFAVLTLGMLRFQLHFIYLQRILVLSVEVRACCDSAVDFIDKKVVSVVVIFKIDVARDFSVTQQGISISLGVLSTVRVLEEGSLRSATVAVGCLHRRVEPNFRFRLKISLSLKLKCPSTSRRPSLKIPCRLQSCPAQEICPT